MTATTEDGAAMVPPHLRVRRVARAVAALLLALALAACTSDPGGEPSDAGAGEGVEEAPLSLEPIVFGRGREAGRGVATEDAQERRRLADEMAGWQEKLELAQRYAAGGFDEQALQVLDGALGQDPPAIWAGRMHALKSSLRVRRAEEELLRIEARGRKDYVAFGEPIDFVIRLRNLSSEVLTLLAPEAGEQATSPSAVMIEIARRDRDIHATELRRTWNRTVFLQEPGGAPIRIPPDGVHEVAVRIPPEAAGGVIAGLRTIEVRGTLRPTQLLEGSQPRTVRLPIRAGRVMSLPRNFEPLAADPLGSMRTALRTVAPAHLLIATEFVPPGRRPEAAGLLAEALSTGHPALYRASLGGLGLLRERAVGQRLGPLVEPLIRALERTPERAEAIMEGLSTVTGVRLAPDPRLWRDWWRREANRGGVVTTEPGGESP